MIAQFIEEFRGTSSAEMQEFKNALTQLAKNLETAGTKIGTDLGNAGASFGSAAGNLETAITKTQETVEQLDSSLQRAGTVVSEGSDRFEIVSDKLFTNLRAVDGILVGVPTGIWGLIAPMPFTMYSQSVQCKTSKMSGRLMLLA